MKRQVIPPLAILAFAATTGCEKSDPATTKRLEELEQQNRAAIERQQQLERDLADQKAAAERDAIERERQRIEDERLALEQARSADAEAKRAALEQREQELARRTGKLEALEATLADKENTLAQRDRALSGRELELAGTEPYAPLAEPAEVTVPVADYGMFYDSLASYGSWFNTPNYGYVWQPAACRTDGWRPYWDGTWVCTNQGWTWMSNEPFGWACYHYGRWTLLRGVGWVWVPGDQWAPAWVCWRESGSHIGWAPLPPETLAWRNCRWDNTVETRFGIGSSWFTFISVSSFSSPIRSHCLPYAQNITCYRQTTNITNIHCRDNSVFVGGPRYQNICRALGRPAPYYELNLDRHRRPGADIMAMRPRAENNRLYIAAPGVGAGWNASLRPHRIQRELAEAVVERATPVPAEVSQRFRQFQEQRQAEAVRETSRFGGREEFLRHRNEELAANQRRAEEQARRMRAAEEQQRANAAANRQPQPGATPVPPVATDSRDPRPVGGEHRDRPGIADRRAEEMRQRQEAEARARAAAGQPPQGGSDPAAQEAAAREQEARRQQAEDMRRQPGGVPGQPGVTPPPRGETADAPSANPPGRGDGSRFIPPRTEEQADAARRLQEQRGPVTESGQPRAEAEARRQLEIARQQQAEAARQRQAEAMRDQQQTAQQQAAEEARKQQEAARQQQLEAARQRQAEAMRDQQQTAQQQAAEEARKQQEAARQQQMEEARQRQAEAAREQQEAARKQQETARQQQMEEARQRQAEAMREQQEAARRQAEEARQRQAEEARQRQAEAMREQQEAARRQAEEARQRQAEEARRQAEEAQRRQAEEIQRRGQGR